MASSANRRSPGYGLTPDRDRAATRISAPGRVSRGLVALAVRVLPVRDRPRYREEFRVELGALARSQRWGYGLRTLSRAWELHRALTETVPHGGRYPRASRDSAVASVVAWLASGAIGGTAVAVAAAPALLVPVLVITIPLATLPLLITTLALVAVYDPKPARQAAAERVLDRLLVTLRGDRPRNRGTAALRSACARSRRQTAGRPGPRTVGAGALRSGRPDR